MVIMNSSPFAALLATVDPPDLGPGPRPGVQALSVLNHKLDAGLGVGTSSNLIRAVVLLWHDHLEAAHVLAQEIETPDGSYVHAIVHRREPDYSNAKYWFRRVGRHAAFTELQNKAAQIIKETGESAWAGQLTPDDRWDAFAFVDACEAAADLRKGSAKRTDMLRQIQKAELEILLRRFEGAPEQ